MSSRVCRRAVPFLCTGNEGERRKLRKVLAVVHLRMITKTTCAISSHSWTTCFTYLSQCRRCTQPSTKATSSSLFKWGTVIPSDLSKLTSALRTLSIVYCNLGEGYIGFRANLPRLRDGCLMAQSVVCITSFFTSIFLLPIDYFIPDLIHKEFAPARIKEDIKADRKLEDLLKIARMYSPIYGNKTHHPSSGYFD